MTPADNLREKARLLGEARKAYASTFSAYAFVHNGNTFLAKAAADEEHAAVLAMAEAEYEIAKSELANHQPQAEEVPTDADRV